MKPLVYIASPYTKGDPAINTRFQCEIWDKLFTDGYVTPYAPLWSHFQHTVFPRGYKDWTRFDDEIIKRCDALLRLDAEHEPLGYVQTESSGADHEVELANALGKLVFYDIASLYHWAKQ